MDAVFTQLIELQQLDKKIKEASAFLDSVPSQLESIDRKIRDSEVTLEEARSNLAANQKKRRDLESDVQDRKERIKKYKNQLGSVRTNKEYSSLLKEIEDVQRDIDILEERIISEMLEADDLEETIRSARTASDEIKKKLARDKDEIGRFRGERDTEKKAFLEERRKILPGIPADQLRLYDKIAGKLDGIALSPVNEEFCSMCYMRIRPQMLNEIRTGSEIIICENCGRILFFEEEPPAANGS